MVDKKVVMPAPFVDQRFKVIGFGGGIAGAAKVDTEGPLDSLRDPIRISLQRLVEAQISSLPNK